MQKTAIDAFDHLTACKKIGRSTCGSKGQMWMFIRVEKCTAVHGLSLFHNAEYKRFGGDARHL